ncbi:MAG TPA: histidine kinase [Candidatus Udaeobacter sp.]|jgi:two-component system LytT family sensor kinase|nr:histidine kinase [Candidatus Udaeobacter sp.]
MSNLRIHWRRAMLLFGGWTLVSIIFAAISYAAAIGENNKEFGFVAALRLNLVQFYLWAILAPLLFKFSRRFPIEFRPLNLRNLLLYFPAVISFAGIHQTIHLAVLWSITPRWRQQFPALINCYRSYFAFGFYIDLIIASLIVVAVHAILYYQNFRASELAQSSLKTQLAQAQLRALKMQLHPHFLFNTLHSISSLVLEDPQKANSMIARLGDFLRLTLENSNQQLVSLKEEAEFVRCYLEIEQVRFGDRLTVAFELEPQTLSAQVPHLILQPVVENAIQHAIAPRATRGHIKIAAKRLNSSLRLEVRDNGPGITSNSDLPGTERVGLSNVRARLHQIYGSDFRFELMNAGGEGLTVVMEIPFQLEGILEHGRQT